jgi:lysosomal alpha-mannosidase
VCAHTHTHTHHSYPNHFAWGYGDDPIMNDARLENYNVDYMAQLFATEMRRRRLSYRTSDVFVTFGCDFQYDNSNINFKNMDKLMEHINSRPNQFNMTLIYSTPNTYVDTLNKKNLTWSLKTDDFFPVRVVIRDTQY